MWQFFVRLFLIFLVIKFTGTSVVAAPSWKKIEKSYMSKSKKKISKNAKMTIYLVKKKFYFSAINFAQKTLKSKTERIDSRFNRYLDKLLIKVGINSFKKVHNRFLSRSRAPSVQFLIARKNFEKGRYKKALEFLQRIPEHHRFYPEAMLLKGTIFNLIDRGASSTDSFLGCVEGAKSLAGETKKVKVKKFYKVIEEKCIMNIARVKFKHDNFKDSLKNYYKIQKTSYTWPFVLIELAWNSYYLNDYNRTLGLLVTYKSPLLDDYFFPEAEVLSALSYLNMCLWGDTLLVVEKFHKFYSPQSASLLKLLQANKNSDEYFFQIMFDKENRRQAVNPYVGKILVQIRKKIYFNFQLHFMKKAERELRKVSELKTSKLTAQLRKEVAAHGSFYKKIINQYIKEKMFYFTNEMNRLSAEMYNIQLEVLSRKREVVYAARNAVKERVRGDFKNVKIKKDQYFWKFNGEFWADELGDFSFGLKSNCKGNK